MATAQFQMGFVAAILSQNIMGGTCCMQAEMGSLWTTLHVLVTAGTMQQSTDGSNTRGVTCRSSCAHQIGIAGLPLSSSTWTACIPGAPSNCSKLDVMRALLLDIGMTRFVTDSCPWGHRDPGNGLPYKNQGCFASWVSLAALERKCACVWGAPDSPLHCAGRPETR